MTILKTWASNGLPALVAAGLLVQPGDARAAPAGDAQTHARQMLLAPQARITSGNAWLNTRVAARTGDALEEARGLILGTRAEKSPRSSAPMLEIGALPLAAARVTRVVPQDAQAQARRLIHGGAA